MINLALSEVEHIGRKPEEIVKFSQNQIVRLKLFRNRKQTSINFYQVGQNILQLFFATADSLPKVFLLLGAVVDYDFSKNVKRRVSGLHA